MKFFPSRPNRTRASARLALRAACVGLSLLACAYPVTDARAQANQRAGNNRSGSAGAAGDAYAQLERAAAHLRAGELARAEAELSALLRVRPREANALNLLGVVRAQQGRRGEAEQLFARAVAENPALVGAHVNLGRLYAETKRGALAVQSFTQAAALAPERVEIRRQLAAAYAEQGEYAQALATLEGVAAHERDLEDLYLAVRSQLGLGRVEEARRLAAPLADGAAQVPPEPAAAFAAAFAARREFDTALAILDAARRRAPDSFTLMLAAGAVRESLRDLAGAEADYAVALAAKPDDLAALRGVARVAQAKGEHEKALAHLLRARKVAPDAEEVLYDFGWTALNLNLIYDALPVLERLHRARPAEPGYLYALAIARLHNSEGAKARELSERYIALRPDDARGHYLLGATLYSLREFAPARAALERSLQLAPYADAEHYLGAILHAEGDLDGATRRLARAVELAPGHAAAHAELGVVRMKQKNWGGARAALEQAVRLDPTDPKAHYQLALALSRLGEKRRAEELFALSEKLRAAQRTREVIGFRLIDPPR